jgi:hypothetical protein
VNDADAQRADFNARVERIERLSAILNLDAAPDRSNSHYDVGGISTIDVIKAKLTPEQYEGFLLGNAVKYALRLNHKDSKGKDAAKLAEYSQWLDEHINSAYPGDEAK